MSSDSAIDSDGPTYRNQSTIKNPKAWLYGWFPVGIGFASWVSNLFGTTDLPEISKILGVFTAIAISVTIHELAHFVTGRALGRKPWCLRIGHGETVFDKEFASFRLILKSLPYSGAVYPYAKGSRISQFAAVLAAPLSNALLFAIALFFVMQSDESSAFDAIPMQMLVANAYLLLLSIIPFYSSSGPNDGMILWHVLRGTPPNTASRTRSIDFSGPSWLWLVKHQRATDFLDKFREPLKRQDLSIEQRCELLDTFVTAILMYGATEYLQQADVYSNELFRLQPDVATIKGTRGSVLVEMGELSAGMIMLEEVMKSDSDNFVRAIAASFLALGHWKQNNLSEAQHWIALSRKFDPNCASMRRIEKLLPPENIDHDR